MRSKLVAFLVGLGLTAMVAPAVAACQFHDSAQNNQSQQTAQAQPPAENGSN